MVTPTEQAFRPQIEGAAGTEAGSFRILIVDDDPSLRRTFPHVLARPGRIFDECGTIGEAIRCLEHEHYALILLDYRLPDATGLALLDWLVDHNRDEAVIIISGEDAIDAAIGALRRGADDYVRKPYHVAQLQRAVDGALHKGALEKANKLMSQRLKASERLHRYLVESSPDLIFTLDSAGRFTYLNPRVKALLGFDRSALMRQPFATLVLPEDRKRIDSLLSQPGNLPGENFNVELRLRRNRTRRRTTAAWWACTAWRATSPSTSAPRRSFPSRPITTSSPTCPTACCSRTAWNWPSPRRSGAMARWQ